MNNSGPPDAIHQQPKGPSIALLWPYRLLLAALIVLVVAKVWIPALEEENFGVTFTDDGSMVVRDFAGILVWTKAVWEHGPDLTTPSAERPGYSVESSLDVTRQWVGKPVNRAMPTPQSPTMLWVLSPLCLAPMFWAFIAFTSVGLGGVWWMTRRTSWPHLAGRFVFFSPLGLASFALGQMAIVTVPAVVFLAARRTEKSRSSDWRDVCAGAAVLWLLTAKPNWAITVGAAMLATRCWRPVVVALGMTVVSTILITPWLGLDWPVEYMKLITHYNAEDLDPILSWAITSAGMSNLRALLHDDLNVCDSLACGLASLSWLGALTLVGVGGLCKRIERWAVWSLCVLTHLLLSPHVNCYEELSLYVLLAVLPAFSSLRSRKVGVFLCLFVPVLMYLSPGFGPLMHMRPSLLFFGKIILVGAVLYLGARSPLRCLRSRLVRGRETLA